MAECRFRIVYPEGCRDEAVMVCVEHDVNPALCSVGQAELEAQLAAAEEALDFAVGAIRDAIYTEDGLDGETGESVLCLLAEWKRDHTFDKKRVSRKEMFAIHSLPYDQVYVQKLESRLRECEAECAKMREALDRAAYALFQIKRMVPEAVPQFASEEHSKACEILDSSDAGRAFLTDHNRLAERLRSWKGILTDERSIHHITKSAGERAYCRCGRYVNEKGQCERLNRIENALAEAEEM